MDDYHLIADRLAADLDAGRLRPGDRLPPQRQFARQHGIANSTAARVYGELIRRGLAVGEVGRGTFIRAAEPGPEPALAGPGGARVDLEYNFPTLPEQSNLLGRSLARLLRPDALSAALRFGSVSGTPTACEAAANLLARAGWTPDPGRLLFASSGRSAIAAALSTLVAPGERLGVEPLTYPVARGIAARLGVTLTPLTMDEHGLVPRSIRGVRAIYLQPALHNPLGVTMPAERRAELAETLRRRDIYAIEDAVYGFLRPELPPLAALAPEHTLVIDSLTKRLAPGLTLGFLVPPPILADDLAAALRSGGWAPSRFALTATTAWITDGVAATIEAGKRRDAVRRQEIAAERLAGFTIRADPHAYHLWWELPKPWRADTFVAAAARHGIAVTPAAAFTVGTGRTPNAVRLALASPTPDTLTSALDTLARLARSSPEVSEVD
jgi:DNA-binding transcriptional MocR family regulator